MTTIQAPKISPMLAQWHECKQQAKDVVLFFRLGDFYELFYEDAIVVSKELNLTLTKRQDVPMCGVPHHASESYLEKLVNKGYSVAIAEQTPPLPNTKGIIERKITRIVTPGTLHTSLLLEKSSSQFIASAYHLNQRYGVAFLELSTGEFFLLELDDEASFFDELHSAAPKELLITSKLIKQHRGFIENLCRDTGCHLSMKEEWFFEHHSSLKTLCEHFGVHSLDPFGLQHELAAINAAGALLSYVKKELRQPASHVQTLSKLHTANCLKIDQATATHLELLEPLRSNREKEDFTLLNHLNATKTAMGFRLLSKWICHPLLSMEEISARHDAVAVAAHHPAALDKIIIYLAAIHDLERLTSRIVSKIAGPREVYQLALSLVEIPKIREQLRAFQTPLWRELHDQLEDHSDLFTEILSAIDSETPAKLTDGNVFLSSYHSELQELRSLKENSDSWLIDYQEGLRKQTDIKSLKVGYSRAFGYFIEVSRAQSAKMPSSFQRRQTLINAERFISPELHEFECKVLSAEEKLATLEKELFERLTLKIQAEVTKLQSSSRSIAKIDVIQSLATIAKTHGYVRPVLTEENILLFEELKHPLLSVKLGSDYIPSDINLDSNQLIHLVTGPNMGGKSTFLRSVALLVIMAQIGSFLPCKSARIGLRDQVFTRIGASDDLAKGRSTFLVEMSETAQILRFATPRSLVILDEIGRGTSTYDGLSIAWAVLEYLQRKQVPTVFATHYFELTSLEEKFTNIKNFHVRAHETGSELIFLHHIESGAADKSYGIQVAKMAGIPTEVVRLAQELLQKFQKNGLSAKRSKEKARQLTLFDAEPAEEEDTQGKKLLQELDKLNLDELSPIQAFKQLSDWKAKFHV